MDNLAVSTRLLHDAISLSGIELSSTDFLLSQERVIDNRASIKLVGHLLEWTFILRDGQYYIMQRITERERVSQLVF